MVCASEDWNEQSDCVSVLFSGIFQCFVLFLTGLFYCFLLHVYAIHCPNCNQCTQQSCFQSSYEMNESFWFWTAAASFWSHWTRMQPSTNTTLWTLSGLRFTSMVMIAHLCTCYYLSQALGHEHTQTLYCMSHLCEDPSQHTAATGQTASEPVSPEPVPICSENSLFWYICLS